MGLNFLGELIIFLLPLVSLGATFTLIAAGIYFRQLYQENKFFLALVVVDTIVLDVVKELNQTVVNDLKRAKADGKLSPEEAAEIKDKALHLIVDRLGGSYFKIIQKAFGSVWILISTKVEAALYDLNAGREWKDRRYPPLARNKTTPTE